MSINKTAYNTLACNGYVLEKINESIKAAFFSGQIPPVEGYSNIRIIEGGSSVANDIPAFVHPILIETTKDNFDLFTDVRHFGKWDNDQNVFRIRNEVEYNLAIHRSKLNSIWINENPNILRDISQTPMAVFASWISEAVGKRFALDPKEQFDLGILAAIFYLSQFTNESVVDERDKLRMIGNITKTLRASAKDVLAIVDKIPYVSDVIHFCNCAEEITGSIRLKEMNVGVLYSILANTWYGVNSKEMITAAIEHPPTWITILLFTFNERSYRNSQIAKITERSTFRDIGKDFVRATLNLLAVSSVKN